MQLLNKPNRWIAGITLGAAWITADAVGFSNASSGATIGQTLDFVVQVRTDGSAPVECASAEVSYGDRRLPSASVRVVVEPTGPESARVRVLSPAVVDEPVVTVGLSVGCNSRLSRRYVVFAEPPGYAAPAPVLATVPQQAIQPIAVPVAPVLPAATAEPVATETVGAPARGDAGQGAAPPSSAGDRPAVGQWRRGGPQPTRTAMAATTRRQVAGVRAPPRTPVGARAAPESTAAIPADRAAQAAVEMPDMTAAGAAGPRLRLDVGKVAAAAAPTVSAAEGDAVAQAMAAVALAASSARDAAAAASAAALRISTLESTVERLRKEAKASSDANDQLNLRLRDATGPGVWFWPLVLVSVALAATAAWLARRVTALQSQRDETWVKKALPAAASADAAAATANKADLEPKFVTADTAAPSLQGAPAGGAGKARVSSAWPPAAPVTLQPDPWVESDLTVTRPLEAPAAGGSNALAHGSGRAADLIFSAGPDSVGSGPVSKGQAPGFGNTLFHDEEAPRDVSIEELIDLEQQAEFFVVLGQDRSAIELLVEHLRSTGGGSPLPYLKLLEIYRRVGDHEDYERTRDRFNHRFNAYAPHWGADLTTGRSLGAYPGVIPRLEQVWAKPVDAMAELEALLFRKSRGELFDLPAYREVLFLYSIARDLLDREGTDSLEVDFLLPMPDGTEFGVTAPLPLADADTLRQPLSMDDLPTSPAGFDVTARDRPRSIFDALGEDTRFPSTRR
jgi:pilus assembly protein FimV